LQTCKTGKQRAFACGYYADYLFSKEKFDKAADYYAQSDKTFEEVSLKFLHSQRFNELIMYLEAILKSISANKDTLQPQKMLLYTWIAELKLNQIN
jgi:vacuolar protein sorting-associated protein 18